MVICVIMYNVFPAIKRPKITKKIPDSKKTKNNYRKIFNSLYNLCTGKPMTL